MLTNQYRAKLRKYSSNDTPATTLFDTYGLHGFYLAVVLSTSPCIAFRLLFFSFDCRHASCNAQALTDGYSFIERVDTFTAAPGITFVFDRFHLVRLAVVINTRIRIPFRARYATNTAGKPVHHLLHSISWRP